MNKPITIYALCDESVRYVGATSNPSNRLATHISQAGKHNANVSQWLAELKRDNKRPDFRVLEIVELGQDWEVREAHWISVYSGSKLLNQTLGGKGSPGYVASDQARRLIGQNTKRAHTGVKETPEACANMRAAQLRLVADLAAQGKKKTHKPPTEETRAKLAAAMTGKKHSDESKAKMSAQRQDPGPELRAKWAEAARNRDPEWKAWFAQQQKGKPKSEETKRKMSEAAKARWARRADVRSSG